MTFTKRSAAACIALVAVGLLGALPAAAMASDCPIVPTSQAFAKFGDANSYFLAPGGDFEGVLTWSRSGLAGPSGADNPFDPTGERAVKFAWGGSWTSPELCVDSTYPHMRFGARTASELNLAMVEAIDPAGAATLLAVLDGEGLDAWGLTPNVPLALPLGLLAGDSTRLRLRITALTGEWRADAVHVDPFRR